MSASDLFEPKFVTFDCYGTLTWFQMSRVTKEVLGPRLPAEIADEFLDLFEAYRLDEVMKDWRPYHVTLDEAYRRTITRYGIVYHSADIKAICESVGSWGPHPDTPEGLAKLATKYKLVILSNAADDQIWENVNQLGAPFHEVITAEQAKAYKPHLGAFEYMLEKLNCGPDEIVHVSSSPRYDLMPAHELGIKNKVYVNRGYEPSTPGWYGYKEISRITELPALFKF